MYVSWAQNYKPNVAFELHHGGDVPSNPVRSGSLPVVEVSFISYFWGVPPSHHPFEKRISMENMENHRKSGFHEINNLFYHHLWKPQIFLFP